jgi:hypothetical protein
MSRCRADILVVNGIPRAQRLSERASHLGRSWAHVNVLVSVPRAERLSRLLRADVLVVDGVPGAERLNKSIDGGSLLELRRSSDGRRRIDSGRRLREVSDPARKADATELVPTKEEDVAAGMQRKTVEVERVKSLGKGPRQLIVFGYCSRVLKPLKQGRLLGLLEGEEVCGHSQYV